jgi:hypothetical protein
VKRFSYHQGDCCNMITTAHEIVWREVDGAWHLLVGNQSILKLIPDATHPRFPGVTFWVSDIAKDFQAYGRGWDAVDFHPLAHAKQVMSRWWFETAALTQKGRNS